MKEGTWDSLRIHPTKLMKMVIRGEAEILGKDKFGRHIYRIEEVKRQDNFGFTLDSKGIRR